MSEQGRSRGWLWEPLAVWLILLVLIAANTWSGYLKLDHFNAAVNFPIAGIIVAVVAVFLMRLKGELGVIWLAALAGLVFLFTLFLLTFGDYFNR